MKSKQVSEFKETEIGKIPADWEIKKINDLYEIRSGLSKPREEFGFGYPFLSFKEIFENFSLPDKLENLVNSSEKERESGSVKRGDVFLTRTSETWEQLGMSSVALKDYENATFNGFAKRLRPINNEVILPEFAAFLFRSPKTQTQFSTYSNLTTRASLNGEAIKQVLLTIPTRKEQEKISKYLSDLTIKISNLQNQNRILEQMAQAIFKSWFVDFDGVTEFVDSELGKIPKGWSIDTIENIFTLEYGWHLPKWNRENGNVPVYGSGGLAGFHNKSFVKGPGIIVGRAGKIGKDSIYYSLNDFCPIETTFYVKTENQTLILYLYYLLKELNTTDTGTSVPNLSRKTVHNLKILIPIKNLIKTFNNIIENIFLKIKITSTQIESITKTRDALLPKLMSGEIRV